MASVCLSELAACKLELRRYDEAVAAYEEAIRCSEQLFDERTAAVNKAQLGTVHLFLEQYEEALGVCLTFPQAQPPRPRSPLGVPIAALSLGPERP